METQEYTVEIDEEGVCSLHTPFDPRLRAAVRAIPGRYWDQDLGAWKIRLGPDRAESVARLVEAFPALRATPATLSALDALRRQRDVGSPAIESVKPDESFAISLLSDWDHPLMNDMRRFFRPHPHPEIGRLSVPITNETRNPLLTVIERHHVRLHTRARERLEPPRPPHVRRPPGAPRSDAWRGWVSTTVVEGKPWFVFATRGGIVPDELLRTGGHQQTDDLYLVPMDGRRKEAVEDLLRSNRKMLADPRVYGCLDALSEDRPDDPPPPAVLAVRREGEMPEFVLEVLWDDRALDAVTALPESRLLGWQGDYGYGEPRGEAAVVVADPSTVGGVEAIVNEHDLHTDEEARMLIEELLEAHARGEKLVELSQAHDAEWEPPPGLHGELMAFQKAGVVYALQRRRIFIADEQGLGKTVQALAAIETADAYPAVVVCPASLKLNWLRECARWLPERSTTSVSGRRGRIELADIVIINYDVLDARGHALAELDPQALIFDESHYCKNPKARRSKAAIELSEQVSHDALRLALTGTPLVNTPRELVPQLRVLGRLPDFGSGAGFERRFDGAEARQRLHWHLRSSCYVRRRKDEVLTQLPPKQRITVPVPLSNEREYRRLEDDLFAWLREAVLDPANLAKKVDSALRAEALVKLNALRHVAALGKLDASIEWIKAFLESGEKLVVFAHHRDVQAALLEAFPRAAFILGGDSLEGRDRNVQRFQAGDTPVCICSLEVASHGFTLTAAASVAFLELGWTPAKHDQAEDRVHRIGQDRHVTAWYLLAADTVDERIASLIDYKRAVVGSVTDGTAGAEVAVVDRLIQDLAEEDSVRRAAA